MKSKIRSKLGLFAVSALTLVSSALAHAGEETGSGGSQESYGWMMGDGWMHSGADMMGYNMWGMGWYGLFIGLAFWIVVILGIIYLYQEVTENREEAGSGEGEE